MNELIRVPQVRLITEEGNSGVVPTSQALEEAKSKGLDLVEISPSTSPPVCKLLNYNKFKYEKKKKEKKQKLHNTPLKEIRFSPNTDEHDFNFKLRHAQEFLNEGSKLKAYVHFAGRSIVFRERGEHLLLRFAQHLETYGKVEQLPKLEGRRMYLIVNPLPKKK